MTPREALCGISGIEPDTYTASGIAGTSSHVVRIPATAFHEVLTEEPKFAGQLLHLFALRIRQMAEQYGMMVEPVSHRVVRSMLRLREQFGNTLPVTHRELAQMSWTTTESAIRTGRHLKRQGFVKGARGQLTIQCLKALEQLLRHPNGHHALQH